MKTFVITTKNPNVEYKKILQNWFKPSHASTSETIEIESTIDIIQSSESDQSVYNSVELRIDGDYRFFLPEVVDPNLSTRQRSEYILDLLCVIAEKYRIDKNDLYLIAHSRDLFPLEDARSGYGIVFNKSLNCSLEMHQRISLFMDDGHVFQFHHDHNEIAYLLLYTSPGEEDRLSALGEDLYRIVSEERKIWGI